MREELGDEAILLCSVSILAAFGILAAPVLAFEGWDYVFLHSAGSGPPESGSSDSHGDKGSGYLWLKTEVPLPDADYSAWIKMGKKFIYGGTYSDIVKFKIGFDVEGTM